MIKYIGNKKSLDGANLYYFLVNGSQKEVREHAFKQFPGCYECLPSSVKQQIQANRQWLSKV